MYTVKLIDKRWIATSTASFILEKPQGYEFEAGQHFAVRLPREQDSTAKAKDATHTFTIASSPQEETLSFATRMRRSSYKDRLDGLDEGALLEISGASGDFRLRPEAGNVSVLIAGGIGITPFRSILIDAEERNTPHPMVLLYSNRRPEDVAFIKELSQLAERRNNFRMLATITEPDFAKIPWPGETGHIDNKLLRRAAPQPGEANFYIAGPPAMVDAMETLAQKAGVPRNQIHAEQFAGYEERTKGNQE